MSNRTVDLSSNEHSWNWPMIVGFGVVVVATAAALLLTRKNAFEQQHANLEVLNPPGLRIELDTVGHRREYREGEYIELAVSYSSTVLDQYKLQVAAGWNFGAESEKLHLSDGKQVRLGAQSVVAYGSHFIGVTHDPWTWHPRVRFWQHVGEHEMYVSTRRVFRSSPDPEEIYHPSKWVTYSNLLKIRVLPNPGWQERRVAEFVNQRREHRDPLNCWLLMDLDAPAATAEKFGEIENNGPCKGSVEFQPLEYDAALKLYDELIRSSDYPVTVADFHHILQMKMWRDHPEFRYLPDDPQQAMDSFKAAGVTSMGEYRSLLKVICQAAAQKQTEARTTTVGQFKCADVAPQASGLHTAVR